MFLQVLSPTLFNQELVKTFRWREFQIEQAKETLPSSGESSAEDKWVALDRECLEIVEVELTVLKPSGSIGDPFVALETKLGKAVFLFEDALVAAVNMFPPISHVDAVKPKHVWSASQQQSGIWRTRKGNVDKPIYLPRALGHRATTIFRPRTWTISDSRILYAQCDHILKCAPALRTAKRNVEEER